MSRLLASFDIVFGVDFSGAKAAGKTIWIAETEPIQNQASHQTSLLLKSLDRLDRIAGTTERDGALAFLVSKIRQSSNALWGIDFPFGLPIELEPHGFEQQRKRFANWSSGAAEFGRDCLQQARKLNGPQHIRRSTDLEQRVPFDPYHYRIIYQTFHGVRDVLGPLSREQSTCILPFHSKRLEPSERIVVEACPCTTLHYLGLPTQMYKQPAGGPLTSKRRRNRREIVDGISRLVVISDHHRRVIMRDPGADALDAVFAAAGLARCWDETDHLAVADHARYRREGRIYA